MSEDLWKDWWEERVNRIRQQVSIFSVLDLYGVRYRVKNIRGSVSCPFHGTDRHPSAYVYPESNSVHCFKEFVTRDVIRFCWDMKGGKANIKFGALLHWIEETFEIGHPEPPADMPDAATIEPDGPTDEEIEVGVRREFKSTEQILIDGRGKLPLSQYRRLCHALDLTLFSYFVQKNIPIDDVSTRLRKLRKAVLNASVQG